MPEGKRDSSGPELESEGLREAAGLPRPAAPLDAGSSFRHRRPRRILRLDFADGQLPIPSLVWEPRKPAANGRSVSLRQFPSYDDPIWLQGKSETLKGSIMAINGLHYFLSHRSV